MSSRKLQVEIDKVLKKVAEGIESFDDIYDKLHDAPNANHKEKYEQDLKKEIKKLQRHRDQIKTWIASSDIKDKRELLENRRNIEKKMEAFKACEKEMKTKAYSKEGLSQVTKIDPKQKLKMEKRSWITGMVDQLNTQIDMLEAEAEGIASGPKKNKKDSAKVARLKELDHHVERHKWHVQRLELILRAMENGNISPEQVSDIQDDVQFYVESNQEDDFVEDEGVYDELGLDDEEDMFGLNEGYFAGGPALATSGPADEDSSKASAKDKDKGKDKDAGSAKSTSVADTSPALHTTGTTGRSTIKLVNSKQPASPAFASKRSSGASPTTPATTIAAATSTTTAATTASPSPYGAKTAGTAPSSSTSASGLGQTPTTPSGPGDSTMKTSAASSTGAVSATTAKDAPFSPAVASKPETNAWANSNAAAKLAKLASVTSSAATQPYSSVVSSHTSSAVNSLPTSHPVTPIAAAMPSPSASSAKSPGPAGTPQPGSTAQSREPSISVGK
ncbi:general negative regulator of transcription subunit 5 [Dimargaris xerosporica]|nr:general negative regulator of transcription subunit 5 [Dimargaris xerosporica]